MDDSMKIIKKLNTSSLKYILSSFSKSSSGRLLGLRNRVGRLATCHAVNKYNVSIFDMLRDMELQVASGSHTDSSSDSRCHTLRSAKPCLKRSTRSSSGLEIVEIPRAPVHPDVKFRPLPFYEPIDELIKPTALKISHRYTNPGYGFHLTPTQVAAIKRESRGRKAFQVQVQVRIGLLETTSQQDDNFPPGITVRMNGQDCYSSPLPTSQSVSARGTPIDVTRHVFLDPTEKNIVQVTYLPHFQPYVVGVYLVRALSWEDLLKKLKQKRTRNAFYTQGMIQQKLRTDLDNEIATTHLRVHLVCPLGKMRMSNPCRADTCQHVQCFDASTYLQMNEKSSKWICPVCNNSAFFKDLVIDGYFEQVLSSERLPSGCTEIQLMNDGGWQAEGVTYNAPSKPSTASTSRISEVDLPSSEDECEVVEERLTTTVPARRARSPLTVDLLSSPSSSSSESHNYALPPKKRKQVLECMDEIFLSSDSEHESSSHSTTSLSQSDSEGPSPVLRNLRPKQKFKKIASRPSCAMFQRRSPRKRGIDLPGRSTSPDLESPQSPEYMINSEKSSLTTLVLRKRSSESTAENSADTTQERTTGEQISHDILDALITSVVENHESLSLFDCFFPKADLKSESSDSEPKMDKLLLKRTKPEEPFLPSILKRPKPAEKKNDDVFFPARPRPAGDKPKRKNLSEVVNYLQPRDLSPESHEDSNRFMASLSQMFLPGEASTESERGLMPVPDLWGGAPYFPSLPYETENLATSSFLPTDFHRSRYDREASSSARGYYDDWMNRCALSTRDPTGASTSYFDPFYVPEDVAENRAEQANSRFPSILRKSRERK